MSGRNVNISKIAELAGVGKATVSRVLNNKPNVSPKTAKIRVRNILKNIPHIFTANIAPVSRKAPVIKLEVTPFALLFFTFIIYHL